jgi:hypothetical protein
MSEDRVSLTSQPVTPLETGYVPPVEAVPLPSGGRLYPVNHPLHGRDRVEIRSMTARDEDILTSQGLLKQGKAISTLLKSCLVDKSIDPESLLVGDRNAILIAIRVTGYGPEYKCGVQCPECAEKTTVDFDLNQLPIEPLGAEPDTEGTNTFSFQLPVLKKAVVFRLMTGALEKELTAVLTSTKKKSGPAAQEAPVTTRLLHQVISIGGETEGSKLAVTIRNLPARDSKELRNFIERIQPGVKMEQRFHCPSCNEVSEVTVPLGAEFFWPS